MSASKGSASHEDSTNGIEEFSDESPEAVAPPAQFTRLTRSYWKENFLLRAESECATF